MDPEKSNDSGIKPEDSPPEKVLSSGIQLRASARVSKKLRLDQEALAQAQSPEKKSKFCCFITFSTLLMSYNVMTFHLKLCIERSYSLECC